MGCGRNDQPAKPNTKHTTCHHPGQRRLCFQQQRRLGDQDRRRPNDWAQTQTPSTEQKLVPESFLQSVEWIDSGKKSPHYPVQNLCHSLPAREIKQQYHRRRQLLKVILYVPRQWHAQRSGAFKRERSRESNTKVIQNIQEHIQNICSTLFPINVYNSTYEI